jgi:hypothetical protein
MIVLPSKSRSQGWIDAVGPAGAVVMRGCLFPVIAIASMPPGTDAAGPASRHNALI